MEIITTRFGALTVDEADIIVFPAGLVGYETCHRWTLLSDPCNDAVAWLQCIDRAELAFAVVSPHRFAPARRVRIARQELASLGLTDEAQAEVVVVLSKGAAGLAMNLKAPLVLNVARRLGCQAIANGEESVSEPIVAPLSAVRRSA